MRQVTIILFLPLIGCKRNTKTDIKTETKTENGIYKTVYEVRSNFTKSNPHFKKDDIPGSWYFHNDNEDANRLAELTSIGKKKASTGLYSWYEEAMLIYQKSGHSIL